jgi:heptaprenyl diphosphate synthase
MDIRTPTQRLTLTAFLGAAGIALFVLEAYIPAPVPFLKIGLANISSVIALVVMGTPGMLVVVGLRVVVGSLLVGTFMSPAFVLALAAGVTAASAMALTRLVTREFFSPIGLSLIGSLVHVVVQLVIVRYVYVQNAAVFQLLPVLLFTACVGGLIVGWISVRLLHALQEVRL